VLDDLAIPANGHAPGGTAAGRLLTPIAMTVKLIITQNDAATFSSPVPYETSLCQAIVAAAVGLAGTHQVTRVRVRVGGRPVDPDLIRRCIREAAAGTAAEHAVVDLVVDPPAVSCRDCGNEMATGYALALLACRECGSFDIDVSGTADLTLESIEFGA
jgi:hydrogenase nickel incorporation protein HypA/HybF